MLSRSICLPGVLVLEQHSAQDTSLPLQSEREERDSLFYFKNRGSPEVFVVVPVCRGVCHHLAVW